MKFTNFKKRLGALMICLSLTYSLGVNVSAEVALAEGEVVVVDENFGVRINNILSGTDRIKSLR